MAAPRLFDRSQQKPRKSDYDPSHLIGNGIGLISYCGNKSSILLVIELGDHDRTVYGIYCHVKRGKAKFLSNHVMHLEELSEEGITNAIGTGNSRNLHYISSLAASIRKLKALREHFNTLISPNCSQKDLKNLSRADVLTTLLGDYPGILENFLEHEKTIHHEEKKKKKIF